MQSSSNIYLKLEGYLVILILCFLLNRNETEILKMLIERGAQLDALTGTKRSPLDIAVYNQFADCVDLLIRHECDVNSMVSIIQFT